MKVIKQLKNYDVSYLKTDKSHKVVVLHKSDYHETQVTGF